MLKLTKTGIGLLTRQYRSVLHKCFLINVGLFALGEAAIVAPSEAEAQIYELEESGANGYTYYDYSNDLAHNYYMLTIDPTQMSVTNAIVWQSGGFGSVPMSYNSTTGIGDGRVSFSSYGYGAGGRTESTQAYSFVYTKGDRTVSSTHTDLTSTNKSSTSDFINTRYNSGSSSTGGAIKATNSGVNYTITGNFIENYAYGSSSADGGAIYLSGGTATIVGDFINNAAFSTDATYGNGEGGAIYIGYSVKSTSIVGNFIGNKTGKGNASTGVTELGEGGGAIKLTAGSLSVEGNFIGNAAGDGGAIYATDNYSNPEIIGITGDFIGNKASGNSINSTGEGGAIYNELKRTETLHGATNIEASFIDNTASEGGAIYNADEANVYLGLVAKNRDIVFYNNTDSTGYNDIVNDGYNDRRATVSLSAAEGRVISFGGTIRASSNLSNYKGIVNINDSSVAAERGGTVSFGNVVSNQDVNVYYGGKVQLNRMEQTDGSVTYGTIGSYSSLNYDTNGGTLSTITGTTEDVVMNALNLQGDVNLQLDVDLKNKVADKLSASSVTGSGRLSINEINLIHTSGDDEVWVNVATGSLKDRIMVADDILNHITGAENPYQRITYNNGTTNGDLVFSNIEYIPDPDEEEPTFITAKQAIGEWSGGTYIKNSLSTTHAGDHVNYLTVGEALTALDEAVAAAGGGGGSWGSITGDITDQTDLINYLNTDYYTKLEKRHNFREKEQNTSFRGSETTEESPLLLSGLGENDKTILSHHTAQLRMRFLVNTRNDGMFFEADEPRRMRFSRRYALQNDKSSSMVAANDNNLTTFKQAI